MSEFSMQIVRKKDGILLSWAPGAAIEVDVPVELCRRLKSRRIQSRLSLPSADILCDRVKEYGVGIFTTEKTVLDVVRKEFERLMEGVRLEDNLVSEEELLDAIPEEFAALVHDLKNKV